jgi:hypothetical protein
LRFDRFGWEALDSEAGRLRVPLETLIAKAAGYFEGEARGSRQAVKLPSTGDPGEGEARALGLDISPGAWERLRREASGQGTEVERLLEHAALLFIADLDAGRVTEEFLSNEPPRT